MEPVANSSVSQAQFEDLSQRLHTLTGSSAMLALEDMSATINEIHEEMKQAHEGSGVSGVSTIQP